MEEKGRKNTAVYNFGTKNVTYATEQGNKSTIDY